MQKGNFFSIAHLIVYLVYNQKYSLALYVHPVAACENCIFEKVNSNSLELQLPGTTVNIIIRNKHEPQCIRE